jgi:CheY-like chemotaxis protein
MCILSKGASTEIMANRTLRPTTPPASAAAAAAGADPHHCAVLALTRDPASRDLLMELALDRGYGLCCAADATEALRTLEVDPPALVIVDVDLPDGRALVRALRADERWRGIPLIGLTATNNPMVTVTLDAPVFFKPDLDGLEDALAGRFEPTTPSPAALAHPYLA